MPAQAGIQGEQAAACGYSAWIPAFAVDLPLWLNLAHWFDPRTSPFIPIPEIATDPNGGTTVGLLPVMLFTDARQQIR